MTKQQPAAPAAETKATKTLTFGAKVGRGITKLTELNDAERDELAKSPESIKARYAKRRADLLDGFEPAVKVAVLAATAWHEGPTE